MCLFWIIHTKKIKEFTAGGRKIKLATRAVFSPQQPQLLTKNAKYRCIIDSGRAYATATSRNTVLHCRCIQFSQLAKK
ncbi:hypothetical protein Fmac_000665 [Flemingia macrophylla]|uniref:Uncharacterized protein n=1 Tax=Flemingia macrophylla TaxID=520843 RepID=A0ABD1NEX1_9FABA